jgi:hypothetical protein
VAGDHAVVGTSAAGVRRREVRDGGSDRWGLRASERERARVRGKQRRQDWPTGQWKGERGEGTQAEQADMREPPVSAGGCSGAGARGGGGAAWANWTQLGFSIFREFVIPFLFIFSRVFNSNSNQVSIS